MIFIDFLNVPFSPGHLLGKICLLKFHIFNRTILPSLSKSPLNDLLVVVWGGLFTALMSWLDNSEREKTVSISIFSSEDLLLVI